MNSQPINCESCESPPLTTRPGHLPKSRFFIFVYVIVVVVSLASFLHWLFYTLYPHKGLSAKWFWLRELLVQANIDYLLSEEGERRRERKRGRMGKRREWGVVNSGQKGWEGGRTKCTQRNEEFRETDLPY